MCRPFIPDTVYWLKVEVWYQYAQLVFYIFVNLIIGCCIAYKAKKRKDEQDDELRKASGFKTTVEKLSKEKRSLTQTEQDASKKIKNDLEAIGVSKDEYSLSKIV